jgi:VWFA-related protein
LRITGLAIVVVLIASLLAGSRLGLAQEDISISFFSVDDTAFPDVTAVFTADQHGRPLAALDPADVEIDESGSAATLVSIGRAVDDDIPLALVVALDVSGSMAGAGLSNAQSAATALIDSLAPADSAAVLAFAQESRVVQPLTQDKALLTEAVSRLSAKGDTALYDAVAQSARIAADSGLSRRAVVLLSDGMDFGNRSTLGREESLTVASEGESLFYVIGVGPDIDRDYLEQLAGRSGGRFFLAAGASEVPEVYAGLAELLRGQFVVTFRASSPAALQDRSVEIRVTKGASTGYAERAYRSLRPPPPPPLVLPPEPEVEAPATSGDSFPAPLMLAPVALLTALLGLGVARWLWRRRRGAVPSREVAPLAPSSHAAPSSTCKAGIVIISGPDRGRSFKVGELPVTVGSGDACAIHLSAAAGVGAEHARIWWRDGRLMLHHIAPRLRTMLAGKTIVWAALENGDEVAIGPHVLRCLDGDS